MEDFTFIINALFEYPISRPALRDPAKRENIQYPTANIQYPSEKHTADILIHKFLLTIPACLAG